MTRPKSPTSRVEPSQNPVHIRSVCSARTVQTVKLPLAFLGPRRYQGLDARDDPGDPAAPRIGKSELAHTGLLPVEGFVSPRC